MAQKKVSKKAHTVVPRKTDEEKASTRYKRRLTEKLYKAALNHYLLATGAFAELDQDARMGLIMESIVELDKKLAQFDEQGRVLPEGFVQRNLPQAKKAAKRAAKKSTKRRRV